MNSKKKESVNVELLLQNILDLTSIGGQPKKENHVLELIRGKLKGVNGIRIRTGNFGLCVVVDSKEECQRCVILDAHADIVRSDEELIKPSFDEKTNVITATGLDDRVSCAILLLLIQTVRSSHTAFVCLFSVEEELSFDGARFFAEAFSIRKEFKIEAPVKEVWELDVTFAKLKNGYFHPLFITYEENKYDIVKDFYYSNSKLVAVIGEGFFTTSNCEGGKNFRSNEKTLFDYTNLGVFKKGYYKDSKRILLSVPVVDMHHSKSYCSLLDVISATRYLQHHLCDKLKSKNES